MICRPCSSCRIIFPMSGIKKTWGHCIAFRCTSFRHDAFEERVNSAMQRHWEESNASIPQRANLFCHEQARGRRPRAFHIYAHLRCLSSTREPYLPRLVGGAIGLGTKARRTWPHHLAVLGQRGPWGWGPGRPFSFSCTA